MIPFPDEDERSEQIRSKLTKVFDVAEAALNFWLTHDKDNYLTQSRLPHACLAVAVGQDVQCCRLFRSVIDQCGRCEAYTANILTRTLYETVLGIAFVLAKRVRIIVEPKLTKGGNPKLTAAGRPVYRSKVPSRSDSKNAKDWLTRELRGLLVVAHSYFEKEVTAVDRLGRIPGFKRQINKLKKEIDPANGLEYERAIGPEWTSILRNSGSYSGLKVAELARVLYKPLHLWYETVYYFQSRDTHGSDPLQHVEMTEDSVSVNWLSKDKEVYEALRTAIGIFLAAIHLLQKHIGFGPDVDIAFASLKRRFKTLSLEQES